MGKAAYKEKIRQGRKNLPKKYQKYSEKSSGNSNITRQVKVCYGVK
jgi:hypothetical protein